MRIAYKLNDGFVITDVTETPEFPHLVFTEEIQTEYDSFQNPKLKDDLSGFEENVIKDVPATISQMKLRNQLILSGISISAIDNMIAQLPQPQKDLVYTMWEYAVLFDRNDETLNQMAMMLSITQEQLDNIFIYGNKL